MTDASAVDAWWKNAIVYCVDTKTWLDSNGDGIVDDRCPALDGARGRLPIGPYGYRWIRLHDDGAGAT